MNPIEKIETSESVGMSSARLNAIRPGLQPYIDKGKAPGFATLVARKGKVVHLETYGLRDVERNLPVEDDTIFRIYSMTKPVTSIALMMLYEQGRFSLTDPVSNFIPELKSTKVYRRMGYTGMELVEQNPEMTIHHLLTHTSGLSYGWFYDSPVDQEYREAHLNAPDLNQTEWLKKLAELPLRFQPGTGWHYSVGTDVLGCLVQTISDMPFEEYLQEKILGPLGMNDTAFYVPEENASRLAALYFWDVEKGVFGTESPQPMRDYSKPPRVPSGGGGLVSTISDYYTFAQMLLNRGKIGGLRIVGRKTLEYMTLNHIKPELLPLRIGGNLIEGMGFGLGFAVNIDPAQAKVLASKGDYGWGGAAATVFWVDPVEEIVGVLMTQLMNNVHTFQNVFRTLVYQALVD
jgi:CubicO group peptidase (beta-lactamase class C family)